VRTQGERIGRYEIELPVGEGSLGEVMLARDPLLGRRVVLKVLREDAPLDPEARARMADRLRATARAFAALSHPGFVSVHDLGETGEGESSAPYLVFEFIPGPTLRERLAGGPLAPAEVASIGRALGSALTHAHAAGFTHGDVKPENVMLPTTGPRLTEPGFTQIARGETVTPFDDQFALASTLYEAITGKSARGPGPRQPPSVAAPNLRSFPHVDTIFGRALAADPRKRFSSCEVLGSVLATELEGFETGRGAPVSNSSIVPRSTRRWQNAAAGVAVLVILALVVLGRQRHPDDGASLTSVASAFSAAVAPTRSPSPPPRHARPAPSSSTGAAPARAPDGAASSQAPSAEPTATTLADDDAAPAAPVPSEGR
jgi:serine/threonine protein kinase